MNIFAYLVGVIAISLSQYQQADSVYAIVGRTALEALLFGVTFTAWSYYLHASRSLWGRFYVLNNIIAGFFSLGWVWLYGLHGIPANSNVLRAFLIYMLIFASFGERVAQGVTKAMPMPESEKRKLGIDGDVTSHIQMINFYAFLALLAVIPIITRLH